MKENKSKRQSRNILQSMNKAKERRKDFSEFFVLLPSFLSISLSSSVTCA